MSFAQTKEALEGRFQYPFSDPAVGAVVLAEEEAYALGHNYIGSEHLLLGLLRSHISTVIAEFRIDLEKARESVVFFIGKGSPLSKEPRGLTPRAEKIVNVSIDQAKIWKDSELNLDHLWFGIAKEGEGIAAGILEARGVGLDRLERAIIMTHEYGLEGKKIVEVSLAALEVLRLFFINPDQNLARKKKVLGIINDGLKAAYPKEESKDK